MTTGTAIDNVNLFTIRSGARFIDMSEMSLGQLVRKGKFGEGAYKVEGKWVVTKEALEGYSKTKGQRTDANGDSRLKYFVFLTADEKKALEDLGVQPVRPPQQTKKDKTVAAIEVAE